MRRVVLGIVMAGLLAGCAPWGRSVQQPQQRTLEDQVEARRKADQATKECVLRQEMRRQQKERGRDVRPFPKEKC